MKTVYLRYSSEEEIPAGPCIRKRKLVKYYTRETLAAVLAAATLLDGESIPAQTPFYYASADVENFDCFREVFEKFSGAGIRGFDAERYLAFAPPTSQFKIMRNMVPCFVSIENALTGDNNVIVDSASALLYAALTAPSPGRVLLGAGFLHADDSVEVGFALAEPGEFAGHPLLGTDAPAIEIFKA
ncbi:MAG: hypothetical protein GXY24_07925 [Bacteroidales bacterium]|jgi:hypothetical protein|nr:hypothetical protein [Bacteroidales bacterium]